MNGYKIFRAYSIIAIRNTALEILTFIISRLHGSPVGFFVPQIIIDLKKKFQYIYWKVSPYKWTHKFRRMLFKG